MVSSDKLSFVRKASALVGGTGYRVARSAATSVVDVGRLSVLAGTQERQREIGKLRRLQRGHSQTTYRNQAPGPRYNQHRTHARCDSEQLDRPLAGIFGKHRLCNRTDDTNRVEFPPGSNRVAGYGQPAAHRSRLTCRRFRGNPSFASVERLLLFLSSLRIHAARSFVAGAGNQFVHQRLAGSLEALFGGRLDRSGLFAHLRSPAMRIACTSASIWALSPSKRVPGVGVRA